MAGTAAPRALHGPRSSAEGAASAFLGGREVSEALLGRKPLYSPDQPFETLHVSLELDLDLRRQACAGVCRTVFRAYAPLRKVELDAADMRVLSVKDADGRPLRFTHSERRLTVALHGELGEGERSELVVRYRIEKPRAGLHFVPPDSPDARRPQVWSHGQPGDTRFWFPCHDNPHTRITCDVRVTVPKGYTAVSNGRLEEVETRGGRTSFHYRMTRPLAPYLMSVAAGRFAVVEDRWEDVPVRYVVEWGREDDARRSFGKTPRMLALFSDATGVRYPYESYTQTAVSEYVAGGMEHTTATTQTDLALLDETAALDVDFDFLVAHELAHQWFGDLLTCRDWSHAWLNEGFATYCEFLWAEHDRGPDEALYELDGMGRNYFGEAEGRYSRAIVTHKYRWPRVLFDRHLYEKGGRFLHLLRGVLGEEGWRASLKHYVGAHQDRTVSTEDLIRSIREATGRNLLGHFEQWVFSPGHPSFQLRYRWEGGRARLLVVQTQAVDDAHPLFTPPVEFRFVGRGWERTLKGELKQKRQEFEWKLPGEPLSVEFDPGQRILKKVSFPRPLALLRGQLVHAKSAVGRIEAAQALARWGDRGAVDAIGEAFRREGFWGARADFASALADAGTPAARRALEGWLGHGHPKVRRAVVEALGRFKRPELAPRFGRLIRRDRSYLVRAQAARALGSLRDPSALKPVRPLLKARSWRDVLRGAALGAFADARSPEAPALLLRHLGPRIPIPTRSAALRALADYASADRSVLPALEKAALEERNERVQETAIEALGRAGDLRAEPALKRLEKDSPREGVRLAAAEALARLRKDLDAKD